MHSTVDVPGMRKLPPQTPVMSSGITTDTPTSTAIPQNSCHASDESFRSAVKDFDSVAEDVGKIVAKSFRDTDGLREFVPSYSREQRHCSRIKDGNNTYLIRQVAGAGPDIVDRLKVTTIVSTPAISTAASHYREKIECSNQSDEEEYDEDVDVESSTSDSSCYSTRRHLSCEGLATIAEEDNVSYNTNSTIFYQGLEEDDDDIVEAIDNFDDDSSLDESTLKDKTVVWPNVGLDSAQNNDSMSDVSTTSSERLHSLTLKDSSTRCNEDFQWICKDSNSMDVSNGDVAKSCSSSTINRTPSAAATALKQPSRHDKSTLNTSISTCGGSLDRRQHLQPQNYSSAVNQNGINGVRLERDHRSRSTHISKSPPRLDDFVPCQGWCCNPHESCFNKFYRRHERFDPQRYGSSSMLMEQQQQPHSCCSTTGENRCVHQEVYGDGFRLNRSEGGFMGCCAHHLMPPCYYFCGNHWAPAIHAKPGEIDERCRKLQYEKENLQLQVQVLSDQIDAQNTRLNELEKGLSNKKQQLSDSEDKLQREILSRSSLETQKLELMSILSELKLQQAALERDNHDLRTVHYSNGHNSSAAELKKPPHVPRILSPSSGQFSSTPVHPQISRMSPSPSPVANVSCSPRKSEPQDTSPKTPPANYKRQVDIHYSSLPRQQYLTNGTLMTNNCTDSSGGASSNGTARKGVAFGRGISSLIGGRSKGYSVPNLVNCNAKDASNSNECSHIDDITTIAQQSPAKAAVQHSVQFNQKTKGIKKLFGRIKRSGSGNLDELPGIGSFQRGGVRATAAARLGWSEPHLLVKPNKPFGEWTIENICDWLQDLGLDQYIMEAKRWLKNTGTGQQLLDASITDIEHELNIKNTLHKKKLQLALVDSQLNASSDVMLAKAGQLDTAWVLRWLDDIGLPQYKENFLVNRVDGRVLHRLTVDDLGLLHVTSMLHVSSIKRGIQVLRENDYDSASLQRRCTTDDEPNPTPKQVSLWTSHRVMEWLRSVDLSEYAPNVRGAGIHGGLMVYEVKFTAELMATLLSIPPGKTLLRRHLNTRFKELVGKEIIQDKREAESTLGYIPLTTTSKLKVNKKSQFSLKRKKSKGEADFGDLVCPLNPNSKLSDDEDDTRKGRGCLSSR